MLVSWRQKVISNFCMLTYSCTHTHTHRYTQGEKGGVTIQNVISLSHYPPCHRALSLLSLT